MLLVNWNGGIGIFYIHFIIQSPSWIRFSTRWMFSIFKCSQITNWFSWCKFITGLWEPSFLGTRNILERKLWLHGDVTTKTACFTRSLWIPSFISRVFFWEKGRGMGGWVCMGCTQNSILYPWMVFKTDVTFIQLEAASCRRPAGQLLSSERRKILLNLL